MSHKLQPEKHIELSHSYCNQNTQHTNWWTSKELMGQLFLFRWYS